MAMDAARKRFRTEQRNEYVKICSGHCEVTELIDGIKVPAYEVHHILKRIEKRESDYFCNLIYLSPQVHHQGHDQHPARLKVACLRSKMADEIERRMKIELLGYEDDIEEHRRIWNIEAMDSICRPFVSIAGMIEGDLLPKVRGTKFEVYGRELLEFIENE